MNKLPTTRQKESTRGKRLSPHLLAQAFTEFKEAADSLEGSYGQLQLELARVRRELEERNRDLADSLQENESIRSFLLRILESLPCGVVVMDGDGNAHIINPVARHLLHTEHADTKNGQAAQETLREFPRSIRLATPGAEHGWVVRRRGQNIHLAVTRAILPGPYGVNSDSVFILRDVTEDKRLESEREAARKVQALAEMSMVLAHEIRNPLASLELFAELIANATLEQEEPHRWADQIQAGLRVLGTTVNNVLQFHNQPPPQFQLVNLRQLLGETVDFLAPLARQRSVAIELAECEDDVFLSADRHRLQQVFLNLALNAFRLTSSGGVVKISGKQVDARRIQILFSDEGPGIDSDKLETIFEPGYSTNPGSPGLGLAVSRKTVEQHGGTLTAENNSTRGATFRLDFPVTRVKE